MIFKLSIPRPSGSPLDFDLENGETVFVLGANGAGKSSLMHRFYTEHATNARRITAHRQTWFTSNAVGLSPQDKLNTETNIRNQDTTPQSRWMDNFPAQRTSLSIYELIDAENVRARLIARAFDGKDIDLAQEHSKIDAPIKVINELLRLSNIPIEISVADDAQVVAAKNGRVPYGISWLSDGERNALLIATDVLTAKPNTLLLIDEPERHLHRSIISPLLTQLFAKRPDCAFVVSTHDVTLPLDAPAAKVILVRDCTYIGESVSAWDADLVTVQADIDNSLKEDILGSRRKLLFIEGEERSLDKPLYSLVFPGISVIAKASCRDVEHAVSGIRESDKLHWLHAFGIIDNDNRPPADVSRLEGKGVYALSVASVESIYYHPEMQRRIAEAHAAVTGGNPIAMIENARHGVIAAVSSQGQRLSGRVAESRIREKIFQNLPRQADIQAGKHIKIDVDTSAEVADELAVFQGAVAAGDTALIISRYPIRETQALDRVAKALGFQDRDQYESAVRKLLMDGKDKEALTFVRSLFGTLPTDIGIS